MLYFRNVCAQILTLQAMRSNARLHFMCGLLLVLLLLLWLLLLLLLFVLLLLLLLLSSAVSYC